MAINQHTRTEPKWVSLREAAKIYAVSVDTLRRHIATGHLPAAKLGYKLIRVRIEDLDKLFPAIAVIGRPVTIGSWTPSRCSTSTRSRAPASGTASNACASSVPPSQTAST